MTSTAIPQLLDYKSGVKPRGIQTEHKTMRFTPLTSYNSAMTNETIRVWIPAMKGFWDPYKSYIEMQVQVDESNFPYGTACQVDNSASSFINQLTVYVDGKQIQRIQEYDTIAAALHDIMYTPGDKFGQQYEGAGYGSHNSLGVNVDTRQTTSAIKCQPNNPYVNNECFGKNTIGSTNITQESYGIYTSGYIPQHPIYITPSQLIYPVLGYTLSVANGASILAYESTLLNRQTFSQMPRQRIGLAEEDATLGSATNTDIKVNIGAYQYMSLFAGLDDMTSKQTSANPQRFFYQNMASARPWVQAYLQSSSYGVQPTTAYNFGIYSDPLAYAVGATSGAGALVNPGQNVLASPGYQISTVLKNGYSAAFSEQLSNSSYETMFAPAHKQSWIHNGKFQNKPVGTTRRTFQVPIISSLFGVLIPAQSYKLLPMGAFQNLTLQFNLNEYAMFTSGYKYNYNDNTQLHDEQRPGIDLPQLKRQWKITQFQVWGTIYQFDDFVNDMINSQLRNGITLCSSGWNIGPRFSLATTNLIKNTWQINSAYQSLRTLCFRIQSDDYKKYSFCRKHYYYSGNVTRLQLKISNTYIPPQPIQGHGGNILPSGMQKTNTPFIIELHKVFNKLFNVGANMYINSSNFAINDRPYKLDNQLGYRTDTGGLSIPVTNIDTAHALPLFHENRCVGRALYAFDLEAIPGEPEIMSGLDTTKWRPFQVIIDSQTPAVNTRDSTLVFLMNYDVVYVLRDNEPPAVYGRGNG